MRTYDAVLVYDGECPYCSIAARALERLDDDAAALFDRLSASIVERPEALA